MKALLLSLFTFTMSVTPSQFPVINQADLDGTETLWAQKGGIDYSLSLTNVKQYGGCDVYCTSLVIPTASVLTLFATPIEIVAAPGAGKAIQVIAACAKITWNSIAYATNVSLVLITDTSTNEQAVWTTGFLDSNSTLISPAQLSNIVGDVLKENEGLNVMVATDNPTAGNSAIEVYVQYRIITI